MLTEARTSPTIAPARWHEVLTPEGTPRPLYQPVLAHLQELPSATRRAMREQMEATLREMGVALPAASPEAAVPQAWNCDLLPHLMAERDWDLIVRGFRQRLRAWEAFLSDVYGPREILRAGVVPVQAVLASENYQTASIGLPRPRAAYLHLCGLCVARNGKGKLVVKQHFFGHAEGISYMVQSRRALARVAPELFNAYPVQPLAESPVLILEHLRRAAAHLSDDPRVVILSGGPNTANASHLSFLARRMGVAMVQGGDLIVLDDCVFLKTIRGLERVDVIYNALADEWLDSLTFRKESRHGVPGLVHCLRRGSVALVNAVGSQLADDASLLPYAPQIIRFYLNESPILDSMPTLWMGDLDQREEALENREKWRIRAVGCEAGLQPEPPPAQKTDDELMAEVRRSPGRYVAQPRFADAATLCFSGPRPRTCYQDHVFFAVRSGDNFDVLPGGLTRLCDVGCGENGQELNGKDTWVLADENTPPTARQRRPSRERRLPQRLVMSRVADSFYWMGRYFERTYHQAYLISVVETLETEELNSAERKQHRPVWNRLLPPLEKSAGTSRRSFTTWLDRYRLVLLPEPGSVLRTLQRVMSNAAAVRDSISPEAWATLSELDGIYRKSRYRSKIAAAEAVRVTRRMADATTRLIPQFFAIAGNTMLADDGWRFCEVGQMLERAIVTANSALTIAYSMAEQSKRGGPKSMEIELSAFLRLLGSRDAYRRIYQQRTSPENVMELLWQQNEVPRSVSYCLERCLTLLRTSAGRQSGDFDTPFTAIEEMLHEVARINFPELVPMMMEDDDDDAALAPASALVGEMDLPKVLNRMQNLLLGIHTVISDSFFSHQLRIGQVTQPLLRGFN